MCNRTSKVVLKFLFGFLVCQFIGPNILPAQVNSRIILESSGSPLINRSISKALTAVLQEVNKIAAGSGNLERIEEYCTAEGFKALTKLVDGTGFFSTIPEYHAPILETLTDKFEVRGIKVKVNMGDTEGDDIEELVFVLNSHLFIDDIHFAIEEHHYNRLMGEGRQLKDLLMRQKILDFLEEFRTAHNRKDIEYLEKAYSDQALIIVGKILKKQKGGGDFLQSSTLDKDQVKFIRLSKREYLDRLRQVFKLNSFVSVTFEGLDVRIHSKYPDIYGIQVKQRWRSSNYSDEGHLFVMMDFQELDNPIIHVRAWQPQPFSNGTVVGLGDFKIIN